MAELKTKPTAQKAEDFLKAVTPAEKQADGFALLAMFKKVTGELPVMWGTSIIGFGKYHYKSERSTQEGDWPLTGFSPRKQNLTLYLMQGFKEDKKLLDKLGKHKTSVGCLYINKLSDVNQDVLAKIIEKSFDQMRKTNS